MLNVKFSPEETLPGAYTPRRRVLSDIPDSLGGEINRNRECIGMVEMGSAAAIPGTPGPQNTGIFADADTPSQLRISF